MPRDNPLPRRGTAWTTIEDRSLQAEIEGKLSYKDIATTHQRSIHAVRLRAIRLGLEKHQFEGVPLEDVSRQYRIPLEEFLSAQEKKTPVKLEPQQPHAVQDLSSQEMGLNYNQTPAPLNQMRHEHEDVPSSPNYGAESIALHYATMDEFYTALLDTGLNEDEVRIVKGIFSINIIKPFHLHRLSDKKLKDMGIAQLGLRESVLVLIGQ
ncbi:hypothetical protein HDU91_005346 [Kappamyces sp. JEL0680]|nr:hypothetical protein HDU91_005346 [Kappamyces sp. JEL0680]